MKVKIKGPVGSVKKLLSGEGQDTIHGKGTVETRKKVQQEQAHNPRQRPGNGMPPTPWRLAEQPVSGM